MTLANILTSPTLAGMRGLRQWIVYFLTPDPKKPGKTLKIPVHYATGIPCSVTDSNNWTDAATAAAAAQSWGLTYGVGFCFVEGGPFWFIDLDSCRRADGSWSPLAVQLVTQVLAGCAVEVSSSGSGLHLFGCGTIPEHSKKNIEHHAECYTGGRFCAMTGTALQGSCDVDLTVPMGWVVSTYFPPRAGVANAVEDDAPSPEWRGPTDDAELLRRALQSRSAASTFGDKASFADLWHGDVAALARSYPADAGSSEPYDRSSADAALAAHLAFWTGRHVSRIERLMRQSALYRPKYDDREDYLVERTIRGACGRQAQVLQDKPVEPVNPAAVGPVAAPTASPAGTVGPRAVEGNTFLTPQQQTELFAGCVYVSNEHKILVPGGQLMGPDRFRAHFGGYTFLMDNRNERTCRNAWEAFTESQALRWPRADVTCFKPRLPFGTIVNEGGRSRVNTFAQINTPRRKGDASPFYRHLEKLLPDKYERDCYFYYLCACVQYQGYKFQWAPVLQGAEGNGKSLCARFVQFAIGRDHVHWPRADKIGKDFNAWVVNVTFVAVEEIKTDERGEVIEILKPLITADDGIEVEKKGVDQTSAEICCNFHFTTNYRNAIRKTLNDRRFLVLHTAQQTKADIDRDGMGGQYMNEMHTWAKTGGFEIVAWELWNTPIPPEFDPTKQMQRAPTTRSTAAAVAESMGAIEQELLEAVERDEPGCRGGWISSGALDRVLRALGRTVAHSKRRDLLQSIGYDWHPALTDGRVNNLVLPDGAKVKLFVRKDRTDLLALTDPAEVARAYSAAQGVASPGR